MNWTDFCERISIFLGSYRERLEFSYDDENITYKIASESILFSKHDFNSLTTNAEKYSFKSYSLLNDKEYEVLVDFPDIDSRRFFSIRLEESLFNFALNDAENKVTYSFGAVSHTLLYYIIKTYESGRIPSKVNYSMLMQRLESLEDKSIFTILGTILRIPFSMNVYSENAISNTKMIQYSRSHLFNIAYNLEIVLKPLTETNELFSQRIVRRTRRTHNIEEINPPRLSYRSELTEQYYMALSSSDPFVKYIGFYHIMEYFFEDVYNEDLLESVSDMLQHPGFSTKRQKDLIKIISLVKKKTRQNKEEFQGSELEALELTIKKFIDIHDLNDDLSEQDPNIIDYYNSHEISFSNGDTINLRDTSSEKLPRKIAARIYKTRNALVHSKSNDGRLKERGIYKPFKNSHELLKGKRQIIRLPK